MSDSKTNNQSASMSEDREYPTPKNFTEFKQYARDLNADIETLQQREADRDVAVTAVFNSHEPVIAPLRDGSIPGRIAAITRYFVDHEQSVKRHHGHADEFDGYGFEYAVTTLAVEAAKPTELARALQAAHFDSLVRLRPVLYETGIKVMYFETVPRSRRQELREIIRDHQAYVSKHQLIKLTLPALEEPLVLQRRRFPYVAPEREDD